MDDEYLDIDDQINRQHVTSLGNVGVSNPVILNLSDRNVRINNGEEQSNNEGFFRTHRTKIGLIVLVIISVIIYISWAVGVQTTSKQQKAVNRTKNATGMLCLERSNLLVKVD